MAACAAIAGRNGCGRGRRCGHLFFLPVAICRRILDLIRRPTNHGNVLCFCPFVAVVIVGIFCMGFVLAMLLLLLLVVLMVVMFWVTMLMLPHGRCNRLLKT